ncbi:glycosyltransferase [Cellulomonas sp. PhB150]|uniref:glycosyltransferase n=1 Tax=Cellulomonas sp. PhB150 TaxID=2485188 RepID=UPI001F33CFA1|nr:glycosyltransferase [Cellulomonas sp. PhB150]
MGAPTHLATRAGARMIRVASVPASHPYVRAVTADPDIVVLPDPPVPGGAPGQWWPPVVLDAAWVERHAEDADVVHVHFGTESFGLAELRAALDAAHRVGWPVVMTVHDLEHPQLRDQDHYVAQLGILLELADAVLTLTPGAADEVWRRWGRHATVVPHPRVLPPGWSAPHPDRAAPGARKVATHLKDLRPGIDAPSAVRALADASRGLVTAGADVEVHLRDRTRDDPLAAALRAQCASEGLTLVEHARLDDDELAAHLATLDACLLPYGHGTHSGWLELCWDLGVPVIVPRIGFLAEQHEDGSVLSIAPFDQPEAVGDLEHALDLALRMPSARSTDRREIVARRAQERAVADRIVVETHRALYSRLVEGAR